MEAIEITVPAALAREKRIPETFTAAIQVDSGAAYLINIGGRAVWLPKGKVTLGAARPAVIERRPTLSDAGLPPIPLTRTPEWPHQREAFWRLNKLEGGLAGMGMGTGKSLVTTALVVNRDHRRVLILAPTSVVNVWPNQFRTHAGRDVRVEVLTGSVEQRALKGQALMEQQKRDGIPTVLVINYEGAWRPPFGPTLDARRRVVDEGFALRAGFDLVVADEAHRIKAPSGTTARFCHRLSDRVPWRLGLSGTPLAQQPLDAWSVYRFLDRRVYGDSFVSFRKRYAVMGGFGGKQVEGYQNEQEFSEKLHRIAFFVGKEVLTLPPETHNVIPITLSAKGMKAYKDLEALFWAMLERGEVSVPNAVVKLLRLQQLTGGFLPLDADRTDLERVDTGKQAALEDLLADIGPNEPVVVFTRFNADLGVIRATAEKLGRRYAEVSGRRKDLTADAKMPEGVEVMGVQISSGGVGIDLTRARYAIYYSLTHALVDYDQSLARVHRPGQTRPTIYYHLVAGGTVDEQIYASLKQRRDVIEYMIDLARPRRLVG